MEAGDESPQKQSRLRRRGVAWGGQGRGLTAKGHEGLSRVLEMFCVLFLEMVRQNLSNRTLEPGAFYSHR